MRPAPVSEQILASYLRFNSQRPDRPHTVGTYLARRLKGRAGRYKGWYESRVIARLERLEADGQVRRVRSAGGRTAWLPVAE
ncbi:MAG: hypothetical protein KatS3mg038_2455 [Candidatus Kapaibacterium sp.]|nr:MAG: hypothetical protein KatS3mg038_0382 [Candidatus Kapabacteria bacterium]GIV51333.1 MAG: hypothetical protein KatS3mg038_1854 [Candidatus Kapabacteria bacterium]GIV51934.1 MAG: hypothetical protein KatS3mg038_2455 [Candidatus Kapabacteria bacterium]